MRKIWLELFNLNKLNSKMDQWKQTPVHWCFHGLSQEQNKCNNPVFPPDGASAIPTIISGIMSAMSGTEPHMTPDDWSGKSSRTQKPEAWQQQVIYVNVDVVWHEHNGCHTNIISYNAGEFPLTTKLGLRLNLFLESSIWSWKVWQETRRLTAFS